MFFSFILKLVAAGYMSWKNPFRLFRDSCEKVKVLSKDRLRQGVCKHTVLYCILHKRVRAVSGSAVSALSTSPLNILPSLPLPFYSC